MQSRGKKRENRNVMQKEAEKKLKDKNQSTEILQM
jgi:hypothetical protein